MKRVFWNGTLVNMYDIGVDEVIITRGSMTMKVKRDEITPLLDKYDVPVEVMQDVIQYLETNLPQYTMLDIQRASEHPDDHYLYEVSARHNDGSYACWTCWNQSTKSLNYGHYNLVSSHACLEIMDDKYNRLSF